MNVRLRRAARGVIRATLETGELLLRVREHRRRSLPSRWSYDLYPFFRESELDDVETLEQAKAAAFHSALDDIEKMQATLQRMRSDEWKDRPAKARKR